METRNQVLVDCEDVTLEGELIIPEKAKAIALFAHGSGSSRFSPRNQFVAGVLRKKGLATLLIDLLSKQEELLDERTRKLRFDIELLAKRLGSVTKWLLRDTRTKHLSIGYFGASTGAAAALIAAARNKEHVYAVVSRGGRPDLAGPSLEEVSAPTLLIVGGKDTEVIELNKQALAKLHCKKQMDIIPGATHLFEEPGALEKVSELAYNWLLLSK